MRRLYTPTEVDAHVYVDMCGCVVVDTPQGVCIHGALTAAYNDGRFEVVTEDDVTHVLQLSECKVFLKEGPTDFVQ